MHSINCVQFCGMNLIIDQGNTATKLAIFSQKKLMDKIAFSKDEFVKTNQWLLKNCSRDTPVLHSSVTNQSLSIPSGRIVMLDHQTPIPIKNNYQTPETLGHDRLANAVAISKLAGDEPALAIDLGTCIKYDLIANRTYLGGNISPGMNMRFDALHQLTDQLPRIDSTGDMFEEGFLNYGISTSTSIINGVQQAIIHEINGFISRYKQEFTGLTIFMTGGDAKFFDKAFKKGIFAFSVKYREDLTLFGLNEILEYNVKA